MAKNRDLSAHPMRLICDSWLEKIQLALAVRKEKFGQYAEEATQFYDGNHDWMWKDNYSRGAGGFLDKEGGVLPNFRITVNKLFEAVALFGPALYHQNPSVLVTPMLPLEIAPEALGFDMQDPLMAAVYQQAAAEEQYRVLQKQACAQVKQRYLDWLQVETDKKTHMRRAITEAIVAGVGYLETEIYTPPGSEQVMPRSKYLSWYDVVVDPDADYWEEVQWIAIKRVKAVNLLARKRGLDEDELKGHMQSFEAQSTKKGKKEAKEQRKGRSFDLIEYWEVYSKNGFGDKLHDATDTKQHKFDYSVLGDYCYLEVAKDIPYPLNIPTTVLIEEPDSLMERVQWPIPFWFDVDGWPISRLTFYEKPRCVWPISLFKPAIGELRFINWCLSFLADKVASSCTTYVGMMKAAGAQIQKQINGNMAPFTIIEISEAVGQGKKLDEFISFLQAPNFAIDIWKMIAEVLDLIDKRTGLSELMYGMTAASMRSATEANIKNQNLAIRPDDMASRVEELATECAVREIQAARWYCQPQDVQPVVGNFGAMVWQNYVMTDDVRQVVGGYDYRIEAGSARKPNKANRVQQLTDFGQAALPAIQLFAQQGNVGPWNAYVQDLAKAMDLDASRYLLNPPDPNQPSPEQQQMQAEMDLKFREFELKIAEMQAKLEMDQKSHEQELEQSRAEHEQELELKREEAKVKNAATKEQSKATAQAAKIKAKQKPKASSK